MKPVNYFFGTNGTGKTTISRIINSSDNFPSCAVEWRNQTSLTTQVYNRDFINNNFNQPGLPGIFTLGATAKDTLDKIAILKEKIYKIQYHIDTLTTTLQGTNNPDNLNTKLSKLNEEYENKFWVMEQKYTKTKLYEALTGSISSKKNLRIKLLLSITPTARNYFYNQYLKKKQG